LALVLDTGVLYGALDQEDPNHERCAKLLGETQEQLVVPAPVLVEVDYWMGKLASVDAWLAFCEDVDAGAYRLFHLDSAHLVAAARLQAKFSDQPLGFVDAAVVVTCEALGESKVATLDQRHFSIVRTTDGGTLQIIPE
jgi:hypothetical protein